MGNPASGQDPDGGDGDGGDGDGDGGGRGWGGTCYQVAPNTCSGEHMFGGAGSAH